jgi:hypothetical protein
MDTFRKIRKATLPTLILLGCSSLAAAQELKQGSSEAFGYIGGIAYGGGAFTMGGGYSYAIRPLWLLNADLGFVTGGDNGLGALGFTSHGVGFGADVNYLFPLTAYPKFTPFVLGGFGIVHYSISCNGCLAVGGTAGGIAFGGGGRWQLGSNWGLRPEIRFLAGNGFATEFTGGVYYQFGK